MTTRTVLIVSATLTLCMVMAVSLRGQARKTVWDGVYSAGQAERGMKLYAENCAACHGAEMTDGAGAPSLAGPDFQFSWNKRLVGDLVDYAKAFMPPGQPGSLPDEQYSDIIAAVLKVNKFPESATAELPRVKAELDNITFLSAKP